MPAPSHMLFVNLAIADLGRSVDFFTKLGFTFDPRFTDETGTCMNINDQAFAMLVVRDKFAGFTSKAICDTATHTEVLLALSCESRDEVDELVRIALANGGAAAQPPLDHGFMYGWSFQDPDGHTWEVFWMDPAALQAQA